MSRQSGGLVSGSLAGAAGQLTGYEGWLSQLGRETGGMFNPLDSEFRHPPLRESSELAVLFRSRMAKLIEATVVDNLLSQYDSFCRGGAKKSELERMRGNVFSNFKMYQESSPQKELLERLSLLYLVLSIELGQFEEAMTFINESNCIPGPDAQLDPASASLIFYAAEALRLGRDKERAKERAKALYERLIAYSPPADDPLFAAALAYYQQSARDEIAYGYKAKVGKGGADKEVEYQNYLNSIPLLTEEQKAQMGPLVESIGWLDKEALEKQLMEEGVSKEALPTYYLFAAASFVSAARLALQKCNHADENPALLYYYALSAVNALEYFEQTRGDSLFSPEVELFIFLLKKKAYLQLAINLNAYLKQCYLYLQERRCTLYELEKGFFGIENLNSVNLDSLKGALEDAIKAATACLQLLPGSRNALLGKAELLAQRGEKADLDEALRLLEKVQKLFGPADRIYYQQLFVLSRLARLSNDPQEKAALQAQFDAVYTALKELDQGARKPFLGERRVDIISGWLAVFPVPPSPKENDDDAATAATADAATGGQKASVVTTRKAGVFASPQSSTVPVASPEVSVAPPGCGPKNCLIL